MKYAFYVFLTMFMSIVYADDYCINIPSDTENGCPVIPYYRSKRLAIQPQIMINSDRVAILEGDNIRIGDMIYAVFYGIYGDIIAISDGKEIGIGS